MPEPGVNLGHPDILIAVLDGYVDLSHPCFNGARLSILDPLSSASGQPVSSASAHGTHVASVIFGQPGTNVLGYSPYCSGIIIPILGDTRRSITQLDLARGIEQAVYAGAHIINISGGQLAETPEADVWLEKAVRLCREMNVLIVAAAGNDGCECIHVPASMPNVLAVGAVDENHQPLDFSNWGSPYDKQGILAPGKNIRGAAVGGGVITFTGTSFATPVVTSAAALILSKQIKSGERPDPLFARNLLLQSTVPCNDLLNAFPAPCLNGILSIDNALAHFSSLSMTDRSPNDLNQATANQACDCNLIPTSRNPPSSTIHHSDYEQISQRMVYALGTLGYDFGNESRRDSFRQLMPSCDAGKIGILAANPYDIHQMVEYLNNDISESSSLTWILSIELTPVYALLPSGPFAHEVYRRLNSLLSDQIKHPNDHAYVERVSIPGKLTGNTVRLFSGQVVPVLEIESSRGIYGWKTSSIIQLALSQLTSSSSDAISDELVRTRLESFLNRVYYDLRNLGTTSQDRALNFAVTNAFQAALSFSQAISAGYELDCITVEKSPLCRIDSDCWDVKLKFFDPENSQRSRKVFRYTIDVSDLMPVTIGGIKNWASAD